MGGSLFKRDKIVLIFIIIFTSIIGIGFLIYSSVEYSMYKILDNAMIRNIEPVNTSTKCMANVDFINELNTNDKMMFLWLLSVNEVREKQSCQEFLLSQDSLIGNILIDIQNKNINYKQKLALLNFIVKKETTYGGTTYGFSYKCKDNDILEKVCSVFDNDDSYEDLYFKKVNSQWILSKIEQRSL